MRSSAPWRGCPFESLTTPRSVATESAYRCGETNHDTATIRNIRARVVMAQKYRFSGFCKTDRGRGPGVPAEGLEPTRSCDHWILSPAVYPVESKFVDNMLTNIAKNAMIPIMNRSQKNIREMKVRRDTSWQRYYYVTIPKFGGGRNRRFFPHTSEGKREANSLLQLVKNQQDNEGMAAFSIPQELRIEALKCQRLLEPGSA